MDALGTAKFFIEGEKWNEAKQVLDIVRPFCKTIPQLDAIGATYAQARDWKTAAEIAKILYDTVSGQSRVNARHSLIKSLMNINKPKEALIYLDAQEKEEGLTPEYQLDKAVALFMNNQKQDSEKLLYEILANPHHYELVTRISFNLATHIMAKGGNNWRAGLNDFLDYGRKLNIWKPSPYPEQFRWKGQEIPIGSTVYIIAEGGIGDEIINVRFVKRIWKMGYPNVVWLTSRTDLAEVFKRHNINTKSNHLWSNKPNEFWAYSMDLPLILDCYEDDLWDGPYLTPKKQTKNMNLRTDGMNIGFKIQGNPFYEQNLHRALPPNETVTAIHRACTMANLYNLDIEPISFNVPVHIHKLGSNVSWEDTLDYIDQMDVVVTSCTSIAHASAAMGKSTIVLVPIMNYYTWVNGKTYSDWYGTETYVIHQTKPGTWKDELNELERILQSYIT